MDADSSDFLATPSRSRTSGSGIATAFRKGWSFLLALALLLPLGISLLSSQVRKTPPPKSFTQTLLEEQGPAQIPDGDGPEVPPPAAELAAAPKPEAPQETTGEKAGPVPVKSDPPELASAASAPASSFAGSQDSYRYRVRPGDTLSEIAQRCGVSAAEIMAANGIQKEGLIFAGQALTIPKISVEGRRALALTPIEPKMRKPAPAPPSNPPPSATKPREVVLGPPVPKEALPATVPVAGLPAPVAPSPAHRVPVYSERKVVLGPPVPASELPQQLTQPVPAEARANAAPKLAAASTVSAGAVGNEPVSAAAVMAVQPHEARGDPSTEGLISYLVQPFDTLSSIAKAHGTSADHIIRLNGNGPLREGQTLLVPIHQTRLANPAR